MALPSPVELLRELIRRPSVNPMGRTDVPPDLAFESRVTDYLESRLRELEILGRGGHTPPMIDPNLPGLDADDIEDLDEAPDNETPSAF